MWQCFSKSLRASSRRPLFRVGSKRAFPPAARHLQQQLPLRAFTSSQSTADSSSSSSKTSSAHDDFLQHAKTHVPQYGWTQEALAMAAATHQTSVAWTCKVSVSDWIFLVMDEWNEYLAKELEARRDVWTQQETGRTARLEEAIRLRLEWILQYEPSKRDAGTTVVMQHWPAAMAMGAQPNHVWTTQQKLHETVDLLLEKTTLPSDTVDSEWDRATLGALVVAAELHLVADASPRHTDTWQFVHSSLQQWESLRGGTATATSNTRLSVPEMAYAATTVGASLLSGAASVLGSSTKSSNNSLLAAATVPFTILSSTLASLQTSRSPPSRSSASGVPGTHPSDYDV